MAQIEYLPEGWVWVAAGKKTYTYTNRSGHLVSSTAKHAEGPNGQTMSLRQAQNIQREQRAIAGKPKPATVHRTGLIRTVKGTQVTKRTQGPTYRGGGVSLYDPQKHGEVTVFVFYSFDEARLWVYRNQENLKKYKNFILMNKYTTKLVQSGPGSDPRTRGGNNSLSSQQRYETFVAGTTMTSKDIEGTQTPNPWYQAEQNLKGYDMSGDNARIYVYASEQ